MNSIMISVKPQEVQAISCGKKRAVVMKQRPKLINTPFKIYLYEASGKLKNRPKISYTEYRYDGRGAVAVECVCHTIKKSDDPLMLDRIKMLGITAREMTEYLNGKPGYICFFKDVKIYDKPLPVERFGKKSPPQPWCYIDEDERRCMI